MKQLSLLLGIAIAGGLSSCKMMSSNVASANNTVAVAYMFSTEVNGPKMGSAIFYRAGKNDIRMDMRIDAPSMAGKNVAVHFHEHGDCSGKGDNTHGHWNPTGENHGKWGTAPFHSGDIGNIMLDANGHGSVSITTDRWSVDSAAVNNIIGKGIIIHGGTDDYTTQPTGNSGPRIGCGKILTPY